MINKNYRGTTIESKREQALGGWSQVYWSAYDNETGYCIQEGFGGGDVREMYSYMKQVVDLYVDTFKRDNDKFEKEYVL